MGMKAAIVLLACFAGLLPAGTRAGSCAADAACPGITELDFVPDPDGTTYVEVGLAAG